MRIASILFLICLLLPSIATAESLSVNQVRFGVHPDKIRAVIDMNAIADFKAFTLAGPYRIVVDLPNFDWKAGAVKTTGKTGVASVRHGKLKKGVSRLVLEMNQPITIHSAFMLPKSGYKPNRLVIDYKLSNTELFNQKKNEIFGNLDTKKPSIYSNTERTASKIPPSKKPWHRSKKLVILDPGHGGKDPGAVGANKNYEKHIVLALAKELKKQLESTGRYRVILTRDRDVYIRLYDRVKLARKHNADLFISIHADSIRKSSVRGASVYTLSEKASDAQSAKLAARENRSDIIAGVDLEVEDQDVANILVDLAMRDTMNQSKFFANKIVKSMRKKDIRVLDRTHRSAGFAVLKAPDVPSILIEAGFMSNRKEANLLTQPSYRKKIAHSIKDGINTYFDYVAQNQN